jgi:hypothetical protein
MRVGAVITHALEPISKSKTIELDRSAQNRSDSWTGAERGNDRPRTSTARTVLAPPRSNDRERGR